MPAASRNELLGLIARHAGAEVLSVTARPGLMLLSSGATSTSMYVTGTMLTVVVQGEKEVFLGRQVQRYGPRQYMVLPVDLPLQAREKAPNDKLPLLGLCLTLDRHLIAELLTDGGDPRPEPAINAPLVVSELENDQIGRASCRERVCQSV